MRGRTIVRFLGQDGGFFQAVFDPESALLRVDLAVADAPTRDLCDLAILARLSAKGKPGSTKPLNLGCFFDPGEYRFEINAFAVEGEPFLDLYQELNPFGRDEFDLKAPHRVSVRDYRDSQDYRSWCWTWWERYGRVGAFRGNYLERRGRAGWEYPQHRLVQHRSLGAYRLVEGEPRQTKVIQQSDGPVKYPHAVGRHLDASFYRDLEQCHVAFVFTHGGPIDGVYQVQRGLDVWVVLLPPARKLGVGNLRHLFLDGCAAFTFRREPQGAHLVKTWIEQAPPMACAPSVASTETPRAWTVTAGGTSDITTRESPSRTLGRSGTWTSTSRTARSRRPTAARPARRSDRCSRGDSPIKGPRRRRWPSRFGPGLQSPDQVARCPHRSTPINPAGVPRAR